MTWDRTC